MIFGWRAVDQDGDVINRAENPPRPTRQRERAMERFHGVRHAQKPLYQTADAVSVRGDEARRIHGEKGRRRFPTYRPETTKGSAAEFAAEPVALSRTPCPAPAQAWRSTTGRAA